MRIAAISDDGVTVSQHFGRAEMYIILTVEDGQIVAEETRPKLGHGAFMSQPHAGLDAQGRHGFGAGAQSRHQQMTEAIGDCQVLIAGGMGWGAYESLKEYGVRPIITDVTDIREAVLRHIDGNLPDLMERVH